jgi:ABC-type polysaccharide/polyol phosphate transport system ATPase subunit
VKRPFRTVREDDIPAVRVTDLGKSYRRTSGGHHLRTLKSALVQRSLVKGIAKEETIVALEGLSFTVGKGESVGLIGSNGSGKSTLLKMVAGILKPTAGSIEVDGRVAALIELGAGFHPEISGRENIYINGAVLGLSRKQIDSRFDDIVEFSGLKAFIDEPVKNYSSGMYVRLGFAVAIHTDPDVLIVDEVLAVGDEAFAHRCLRRIEEFLAAGKTLLLVSHSLGLIEEVSDRVLWLEGGTLRASGHPRRVIDAYREEIAETEGRSHREEKQTREVEGDGGDAEREEDDAKILRWGNREVEIESLRVMIEGREHYHLKSGQRAVFEIQVQVHAPQEDFVFGLAISTPRGVECWGTNTELQGFEPRRLAEGPSTVSIECPNLRLAPGEYLIDVAVHAHDGTPYDYRRHLVALSVTATERGVGLYFPENRWTFSDGVDWQPDERPATEHES